MGLVELDGQEGGDGEGRDHEQNAEDPKRGSDGGCTQGQADLLLLFIWLGIIDSMAQAEVEGEHARKPSKQEAKMDADVVKPEAPEDVRFLDCLAMSLSSGTSDD